jgi:hypothetical protein
MYEMEVSAIYLMVGCNDKLDRYNDRTMFEVLTLNERVETPATSTCLSVTCLDINTGPTIVENKHWHIESVESRKNMLLYGNTLIFCLIKFI